MKVPKKIWIGAVIIGSIVVYVVMSPNKTTLPDTTTVKRGDIVQEVSVTGRVKPTSNVDLGFEKSGRVANIYVTTGSYVNTGQLLAKIESTSAEGTLKQAEARLAELQRGTRPEELVVKKTELAKYTQELENAYNGIPDILDDAFTKADNALHTQTTDIFTGSQNTSYQYSYSICDTQLVNDGEWLRYTAEDDFSSWRKENASLPLYATKEELSLALTKTKDHLNKLSALLSSIGQSLSLGCTVSNSALDTYRTNINTARTNINTARTNINTKEQTLATLALSVQTIKDQLLLLEAGTAAEVLDAQEGAVITAKGDLAKYSIFSPISGVVTKADIKKGEEATVGKTVFTIISDTSFKIEVPVPEADIAKININDTANITLDAYGSNVIFKAVVTKIDPAETIIDNVPTYTTTLYFTEKDKRIKSGMTANIDILSASKSDTLFVPVRSVISKSDGKFLRVVNTDNTTTDTLVTTGIRASDGTIEILSGVSSGTTIVIAPTD